jgi:hypothetical protein
MSDMTQTELVTLEIYDIAIGIIVCVCSMHNSSIGCYPSMLCITAQQHRPHLRGSRSSAHSIARYIKTHK